MGVTQLRPGQGPPDIPTYPSFSRGVPPSDFAASTSAIPDGRIRPGALSSSSLATLTCDQRLRGWQGTYFWRK
jgi:hypothetical protein